MNNTRIDFNNFADVYSFAQSVNVPVERSKTLDQLTAIERQRLSVQRAWVIEVRVQYTPKSTDPANPNAKIPSSEMTRIYTDLQSFNREYSDLCLLSCPVTQSVKITGFSVYQMHHDSETVIHLDSLSGNSTLSSQLNFWTGCSYNSHDFHNENYENNLSAQGTIVHRKTGQKFFIPPVAMDILAKSVGSKYLHS